MDFNDHFEKISRIRAMENEDMNVIRDIKFEKPKAKKAYYVFGQLVGLLFVAALFGSVIFVIIAVGVRILR